VFGRLELEWCERKILLPGWWLEAGAGRIGDGFTIALEAPAEHGESLHPARQKGEYPKFNLVYIFKLSKETTDNNHVFFGILQLVRGFSY